MTPVPLLGAKLLPPSTGPLHLPRPRLHRRLASGLEGRATFVVAGPGYGKTGLVARFLRDLGGDSVWYWLDPSDRDPWMLFRYLIQGVKEHAPEFGERSEGLWDSLRSASDEPERLADIFMSDAQESLGGRLVIVLDNAQHLAGNDLCARALRRLVAYLPGALHLVLTGRSLPEPGLKTLGREVPVNVLQGDDLLFTPEETRTLLLQTFALPMKDETIARVHARTRGWVTALQLLRQTARLGRGAPDLPDEVFVRTEAEIFDYFSEEVLSLEAPESRDVLLGSALPAVIDPDVCAEVLERGDAGTTLLGLVKRNLFISPLESGGELYAYDPLFRDFLKRKLRAEKGAEGTRDLDRRYGRALARRGDFAQALAHYLAADDARSVLGLLERHGKALLRGGMIEAVREGAQFLAGRGGRPPAVVDDLLGEACRLAGDFAAAVRHFEKALQAEDVKGVPALSGAARAGTLQGFAYALLKTGDAARAARVAEEAHAQAGSDDPALLARILNTLSIIRYRENRHREALAGWQEALACARQAADRHLTLMIAHNLGLPHAVLGDFRRAAECFQILTGPDNTRLGPEEGAAYLNLARIELLSGEPARAAEFLGDAREIAHKWGLESLAADVLEAEGQLMRETGDLDGAAAKYAQARALFTEMGLLDLLDGLAEEEAILAVRRGDADRAEGLAVDLVGKRRGAGDTEGTASALLALGEIRLRASRPERALAPLEEASRAFESLGHAFQRCLALMLFALASHRLDRRDRAARAASQALALSAQFDYRVAILRLCDLDVSFRGFLTTLPDAPAYLRAPGELVAPVAAPRPVPSPDADLHVRLLGPTEVYRTPGRTIPASAWKIRRALQIFCYLASSRGRRATKDRIVDALWGDARLSVIDKNFHPTISFLRRALNFGHNVPKNFIVCERGAYLLNPDYRYDLDTERFETLVRSARGRKAAGQARQAVADYEAALALYRGPFLEEEFDEWAEAPRAHYEELLLAALKEAAEVHLRNGNAAAAIDCLHRLAVRDPLNEETSARLMRALGAHGSRAAVEKEYARLQAALDEELGTSPLSETRRAYDEALSAGVIRPVRARRKPVESGPRA